MAAQNSRHVRAAGAPVDRGVSRSRRLVAQPCSSRSGRHCSGTRSPLRSRGARQLSPVRASPRWSRPHRGNGCANDCDPGHATAHIYSTERRRVRSIFAWPRGRRATTHKPDAGCVPRGADRDAHNRDRTEKRPGRSANPATAEGLTFCNPHGTGIKSSPDG